MNISFYACNTHLILLQTYLISHSYLLLVIVSRVLTSNIVAYLWHSFVSQNAFYLYILFGGTPLQTWISSSLSLSL